MRLFKKSMHCFSRRVTLRACDTSFKDDIKNTMLRKVVLKHPKWVKPISISIEVVSVLIVILTIWSILVGVKSLVSLYVYGTCNPTTPSACSLDTTEACTIDAKEINFWADPMGWLGNWFTEYGEALMAVPSRMKNWNAQDYLPEVTGYYGGQQADKPIALDIFDPSCIVCQRSFNEQLKSGFFKSHNVALLPYPIPGADGGYKFPHSYLLTQYIIASQIVHQKNGDKNAGWGIAEKMFTGKAKNGNGYQDEFNLSYDDKKAEDTIKSWLKEFGYTDEEIKEVAKVAKSDKVKGIIEANAKIVEDKVQTKKIPTMIYDGIRHDGEFKANK